MHLISNDLLRVWFILRIAHVKKRELYYRVKDFEESEMEWAYNGLG